MAIFHCQCIWGFGPDPFLEEVWSLCPLNATKEHLNPSQNSPGMGRMVVGFSREKEPHGSAMASSKRFAFMYIIRGKWGQWKKEQQNPTGSNLGGFDLWVGGKKKNFLGFVFHLNFSSFMLFIVFHLVWRGGKCYFIILYCTLVWISKKIFLLEIAVLFFPICITVIFKTWFGEKFTLWQ